LWSPDGVRGRPQRVPSGGRRLLLLPPPPSAPLQLRLLLVLLYIQMGDKKFNYY